MLLFNHQKLTRQNVHYSTKIAASLSKKQYVLLSVQIVHNHFMNF
jgi:hypothetical protein